LGERGRARLSLAPLGVLALALAAAAEPAAPGSSALERARAAAMEGRKADALAAAQQLTTSPAQYAVLVRFGLWDELIALGSPDPGAPALSAGYLYGRGVALAARGRLVEARADLADLQQLAASQPQLADLVAVAAPIVAARIAASERRDEAAVAALERAVSAEERLSRDDPGGWFFPVRDLLGAQLLIAARPAEAERVYQEELVREPASGWALYGLAAAERVQGHARAAAATLREFAHAWRHADVRAEGSAFWFAGPDTTTCECQRPASVHR
jgi:hypothetical protein